MNQAKKGNNGSLGIKPHIGVDADSGLAHTVTTMLVNNHDITQTHTLALGEEEAIIDDSGYLGVEKSEDTPCIKAV